VTLPVSLLGDIIALLLYALGVNIPVFYIASIVPIRRTSIVEIVCVPTTKKSGLKKPLPVQQGGLLFFF